MKKVAITLVGVLSLVLATGLAWAQTQKIQADVPFGFTVNGQMLSAGLYTITPADKGNTVLLIRSDAQSAMVPAPQAEQRQPSDKTKLVFRCYGGSHYFLAEIWVEGNTIGRHFTASSQEKEYAANSRPQDAVIYAALR